MSIHIPMSPLDHFYGLISRAALQMVNPIWLVFSIFLFLLSFFAIERHRLSWDNAKVYKNKAVLWSEKNPAGTPTGIILGKWFIGFESAGNKIEGCGLMTVYTLRSTHTKLCKTVVKRSGDGGKPKDPPDDFYYYAKRGSYKELDYTCISSDIIKSEPRDFQKKIIQDLLRVYDRKRSCAILISGPPGCGKSTVCDQLIRAFAQDRKISCNFTDEFRPTEASDLFQSLYQSVCPEEDNPLIVLVDEVDGILRAISSGCSPSSGVVAPHPKFLIQVKNKNEWNTFMDKIDKGRWKHLIFVMTTNLTLAQIDALDSSYTRPGRCDLRFELGTAEAVPGMVCQIPAEDGLSWRTG